MPQITRRKVMAQITRWLQPSSVYNHKTQGKKSNAQFCQEVADEVNRDGNRKATVKTDRYGMVAVFTEKVESK